MVRILWILLVAVPATAVTGDLDRDGDVDLADFFIFGTNFGKVGEVILDTVVVEIQQIRYDTLVIEHATVFDATLPLRG